MAYSSNVLKQTWTYDPDGDTHNDRIGKILSRGADLRGTFKAQAQATVSRANQLENEEKNSRGAPAPDPKFLHQTSSASGTPPGPDGRGMVWVDGKGTTLGSVSEEPFKEPARELTGLEGLNEKQTLVASMAPIDRSMHMWRKIQPGVMRSTTQWPESTMKDHFVYEPSKVPPVNMKHHYKKSEFSDYVENKVKVGNAIT